MDIHPIALMGRVVRLEPISEAHVSDLAVAGADESIWQYMVYGAVGGEAQMRVWVRELLSRQALGTDLPFAVVHLESGRAMGSTRYLDIQRQHR